MTQAASGATKPERLYDSVLDEETRTKALAVEGVDDELAILRGRLLFVMKTDDENITRITRCAETILRLVRERYRLTPRDAEEIIDKAAKAIEAVTRGVLAEAQQEVIDDV